MADKFRVFKLREKSTEDLTKSVETLKTEL